jgi:hypothetical protein
VIARRIHGQKGKRGNDGACVPKADHPGAANAAACVPAQIHDVPAYDDGGAGEVAHGDHADAQILCGEGVSYRNKDGDADDGEYEHREDEGAAQAGAVGEIGGKQTNDKGTGHGWNGAELCLHDGEAICSENSGSEVREGVKWHDECYRCWSACCLGLLCVQTRVKPALEFWNSTYSGT